MRLKPAGVVLISLLLILCPLGAVASYVALTGVAVGPLGTRATATAIPDVMVVSTRALREKPTAVQRFVDAWFEAIRLTTDDDFQPH